MSTPQSRDLARDGHTPADPGSTKTALTSDGAPTGGAGRRGRVPEANQPGHHPDHEQDKPVEVFVAKAAALAAAHDAHRQDEGHEDVVASGRAGVGAPRAASGAGARSKSAGGQAGWSVPAPPPPGAPAAGAPAPGAAAPGAAAPGAAAPGVAISGLAAAGRSALRLEVAVPAVALVDAARRPGGAWDEIGESRTAWLARIGLLGPLGAWRYSTTVRPRLEAAERALSLAGA